MPPTSVPDQRATHNTSSSTNAPPDSITITRNGITVSVSIQGSEEYRQRIFDKCHRTISAMIDNLVADTTSPAQNFDQRHKELDDVVAQNRSLAGKLKELHDEIHEVRYGLLSLVNRRME